MFGKRFKHLTNLCQNVWQMFFKINIFAKRLFFINIFQILTKVFHLSQMIVHVWKFWQPLDCIRIVIDDHLDRRELVSSFNLNVKLVKQSRFYKYLCVDITLDISLDYKG